MIELCEKCGRVMSYDPYFKTCVCRQCGSQVASKSSWKSFGKKQSAEMLVIEQKHEIQTRQFV